METFLGEIDMIVANFRRSNSVASDMLLTIAFGGLDEGAMDEVRVANIIDVELVVVRASHEMRTVGGEDTLKLVKDAVIFVQVAEFGAKMIVDLDGADGVTIHVDIPELEGEIIARKDVASIRREFDIRDGGDDLGEEGFAIRVFLLLEGLSIVVAQGGLASVAELDNTLAGAEHEKVAMLGMALGGCDDFGELLHVRRLDINNIKTMVARLQIPKVDAQVIRGDKGFGIAVERDRIDVVGVGTGKDASGGSRHDGLRRDHRRENKIARRRLGGGKCLLLLLVDLPELDGLVVGRQQEQSIALRL